VGKAWRCEDNTDFRYCRKAIFGHLVSLENCFHMKGILHIVTKYTTHSIPAPELKLISINLVSATAIVLGLT